MSPVAGVLFVGVMGRYEYKQAVNAIGHTKQYGWLSPAVKKK